MKNLYTMCLVLLTGFASFSQTFSFSGTGALNANGWQNHSGTPGQQTILTTVSDSGNSLSKTGLAPSVGNRTSIIAGNAEDVNIPLTAPITATPVYYSALVKFLDGTTLNVNGDYSLCLTPNATTGTTSFAARIYTKPGTTPNTVLVGILNTSVTPPTPSYPTTELAVNATHLIVVKYDFATNSANIYLNPTPGAAEPTPSATNNTGTGAAPTQIAGFVIRQGGTATAGTGNVEYDEIRVGTSFAAVTPTVLSNQKNEIAGLSIYPNPAKDGKVFITSDANDNKQVLMFDLLGKQVLKANVSSEAINVSTLASGAYFVKITENGKSATRKLLIQ